MVKSYIKTTALSTKVHVEGSEIASTHKKLIDCLCDLVPVDQYLD